MFNHSRRNLALWFTLSMGSILILFAGVTYYLRAEDRLEATDRLLYKKTTIMAASVKYDWVEGDPQVDLGNVPLLGNGLRPLGTEIVYVRWYDAKRQLKRFFGTSPTYSLTTSSDFRPDFQALRELPCSCATSSVGIKNRGIWENRGNV